MRRNNAEESKMRIARNIRTLLAEYNMSQLELAEKLDVSTSTVSDWCKGNKMPRVDKLAKLCDIFGIRVEDIYTTLHRSTDAINLVLKACDGLSEKELKNIAKLIKAYRMVNMLEDFNDDDN